MLIQKINEDKPMAFAPIKYLGGEYPSFVGKNDRERMDAACAYYETGKSYRECEMITGMNYKTISNECKRRGIIKGGLAQLVTAKAEVDKQMVVLSSATQNIVSNEAALRQKHIEFFNNAALTNVSEAMKSECDGQQDFKARAETINKGRETVLGKTPDVAVQVNNSISLEDLLKDL
jgi:hypothetical protein